MNHLLEPFWRFLASPAKELHPWVVHFPLVFLGLEFLFLACFFLKKKPEYEAWAWGFLQAAFWTMLVAAAFGFHDSGVLQEGSGWPLIVGWKKRWETFFEFDNLVTVHFWLALLTLALTGLRFGWRGKAGPGLFQKKTGALYAGLVLFGAWCLVAMSYAGGLVSHE